jgi:hypothetical protein
MTITYCFKISSVNKLTYYVDEEGNTYNNLISKINYQYIGTDEDNLNITYNSYIDLPKPTSANYKNYDELTEADLISWLESLISSDAITLMQNTIINNIQDIKTRTSSLPWSI